MAFNYKKEILNCDMIQPRVYVMVFSGYVTAMSFAPPPFPKFSSLRALSLYF